MAHAERDIAEKRISEMQGALDDPRANIEALSQELGKTQNLVNQRDNDMLTLKKNLDCEGHQAQLANQDQALRFESL